MTLDALDDFIANCCDDCYVAPQDRSQRELDIMTQSGEFCVCDCHDVDVQVTK